MSAEHNPYAAPHSDTRFLIVDGEAEETRRCHLEHEATIKLIGWLHILVGLFLLVSTVEVAWEAVEACWFADDARRVLRHEWTRIFSAASLAIGGALLLWNGYALRKLGGTARIAAMLLYVAAVVACFFNLKLFLGLIIIAGYQVYCLAGVKGRTVCSAEYRRIVARTPALAGRSILTMFGILALAVLLLLSYVGMILYLA